MPTDSVVHVIDDDDAVRESLSFLLETARIPSRTYASAVAYLAHAVQARPGCIITDIRMPELDGVELLRRLKAAGVSVPVIVITGHGDVPLAVEAMKLGAFDFLEKPFDDERLIGTVRDALSHDHRRATDDQRKEAVKAKLNALSAREQQVLHGLVAGHPNKIIAHELGISARTVEVYRANLMNKTRASSLSELVRMALLAGL